ncbi:MAG: hypothetical protein APF77_18410 [Clostridia bacterium BRH_c25]|nr:MAG: hypothetical protein APF77_18410 [Clostridia bacterium BRH_c25]
MNTFSFNELQSATLIVDAIYKGGDSKNVSDDPISKLIPGIGNQGGFRVANKNTEKWPAYVILYTSGEEQEWPDSLDLETGTFRYFGDNRSPGHDLHSTKRGGNLLLNNVFKLLSGDPIDRKKIPPFLIFQKSDPGRSVRFLGLAAPGSLYLQKDKQLIAIWRTKGSERFQNYEAHFTILDTAGQPISKKWLTAIKHNDPEALNLAPDAWKIYIEKGINGLIPLKAPKIKSYRTKEEQLPYDRAGMKMAEIIYNYFKSCPTLFEACAAAIIKMMDSNFYNFDLTRPWRDGGRDALGRYKIGFENEKLFIDCALEAKLYDPYGNGVGVKSTSRLISRIKHRQFGVLVTTSYIGAQACQEIREDGHPVLLVCCRDIIDILKRNSFDEYNLENWLVSNYPLP